MMQDLQSPPLRVTAEMRLSQGVGELGHVDSMAIPAWAALPKAEQIRTPSEGRKGPSRHRGYVVKLETVETGSQIRGSH